MPSDRKSDIRSQLKVAVERAIQNGYRFFGAGGALEFDTMAAQIVLECRQQYPHIRLIIVLPCVDQTSGWKQSDIDEYEPIRALADKVVYTSKIYYSGCMFKRNRHLVDNSSLCICYLTRQTGGTAYTVQYAESKGVTVLNPSKQP